MLANTNSTAEYIQKYADMGFTTMPLRGKRAIITGWRKIPYNPFPSLEGYPSGNFGVILGATDLVIDVDPRNFKAGTDPFKALLKAIGELPDTFVVRTGGGGLHIYLKKPADLKIKGQLKDFLGVEFKTDGQYLVGATSIHPDSKRPYDVEVDNNFQIADAPTSLLELIEANVDKFVDSGIDNYVSDEQTKQRFKLYLEKAPVALQGQGGDLTTFGVAATAHDFGLHPELALEIMLELYNPKCEPPWEVEELRRKVFNAYKYSESPLGNNNPANKFPLIEAIDTKKLVWETTVSGKWKPTLNNTVNLFFLKDSALVGLLGWNVFAHRIQFIKKAPWHKTTVVNRLWSDDEALECRIWIANHYGITPTKPDMHDAARKAASAFEFHPVKDYLENIVWDGYPRLNTWLNKFLGVEDNDYSRAVGLKFLVAAVKRIYEPGCQSDYMLVLEGAQGLRKSEVFKIMAGDYYADIDLNLESKDAIIQIFGKWIVEQGEMGTHYRSETKRMKNFLTRRVDTIRLPYDKSSTDVYRSSIFVGTINPEADTDDGWMKDTTGGRRYWPVKVTFVDEGGLREIRNQLWAEAMNAYRKGVSTYFDDKMLEAKATEQQTLRLGFDPWHESVIFWLNNDPVFKERYIITDAEIYEMCIGGKVATMGRRETGRLFGIMSKLAWKKDVYYDGLFKKNRRGYKRPDEVIE